MIFFLNDYVSYIKIKAEANWISANIKLSNLAPKENAPDLAKIRGQHEVCLTRVLTDAELNKKCLILSGRVYQ